MSKPQKVMIFAGEASGDLQGALLARELKKYNPDIEFSGVGGVRMKEEGIDLIFDSTTFGVIGPWEGIKNLPRLLKLYNRCRDEFVKTRPDLAILIDTPAFNMRLAKVSREKGIKAVYYFPPSAWSGNVKRANEIAGQVDSVITAFRFTANTYKKGDIPHFYAGHPLVDVMQKWKTGSREGYIKDLGLEEGPTYVGLMPGSRTQEINHVLPLLLDAARKMSEEIPGVHFLLPIASPLLREKIYEGVQNCCAPITVFDGRAQEIMAVCRLIVMASGSASLEASIMGVPMILTYRLNQFDYKIIRMFVKLKWAGLPNLIMERGIVPELIQEQANVENICSLAKDLLPDGQKRQKMIQDLQELNISLGEPGVVSRVARHIWEDVL